MPTPTQPVWPIAGAPTTGKIPSQNLIALCNYYVRRLIFQYADKPNAQRLIAILVKQGLCDDLMTSLLSAFTLATAVGPQLDILGKYIGGSRVQGIAISPGYFSLWDYASVLDPNKYLGTWNPVTDVPPIPAAAAGNNGSWYVTSQSGSSISPISESFICGDIIVSNGTIWSKDTNDCGNGLTDYTDLGINANAVFYGYGRDIVQVNTLTDPAYRTALQLKAIINTSDGTTFGIMKVLNALFPNLIFLVDNQNMTLTYYVASTVPLSPSTLALFLPKPMGVGINIVIFNPSQGDILTEDGLQLLTEGGVPITIE